MEGALFPLDFYICISQCLQDQRHVLHVLFIDFGINKDIIEVGEDEYIEIGT
jgi:hypothetical protein